MRTVNFPLRPTRHVSMPQSLRMIYQRVPSHIKRMYNLIKVSVEQIPDQREFRVHFKFNNLRARDYSPEFNITHTVLVRHAPVASDDLTFTPLSLNRVPSLPTETAVLLIGPNSLVDNLKQCVIPQYQTILETSLLDSAFT